MAGSDVGVRDQFAQSHRQSLSSLAHWERAGVRESLPHADASACPHPIPLPEGEGIGSEAASQNGDGDSCDAL